MKNVVKKLRFATFLLVGSGLLSLTSCGNGELTQGKAEDALEEGLLQFQDNSQYVSLPTGYIQVDKQNERDLLQKLAQAGVITYKPEQVIEYRRSGWYGSSSYREVEHYFATVALTPEGEKYVIEPVNEIKDKDMEVKAKKTEKVSSVLSSGNDTAVTDSLAAAEAAAAEEGPDGKSDYEIAKGKVHSVTVYVLSHKNKLVTAKNIFCPEDMLKKGAANCDYVYEVTKVTPFGRIVNDLTEGERHKREAAFVHYIDEGWRVK